MSKYVYIKKLIRDDGATLTLDQEEIYLADDNTLLVRPDPDTAYEDYTEADGGEFITQKLPSFPQEINGVIVPKTTPFWTLRTRLVSFFQHNHTYSIVYEKRSGETFVNGDFFKSGGAWIEENLQVPPEPKENFARWSVTLRLGSAGYQEYSEDSSGKEIFTNNVDIFLSSLATGGRQWDQVGAEWDGIGSVWTPGEGGLRTISVNSASRVYPTWTVAGGITNPSLRDNTDQVTATYLGTIYPGQTLIVDFSSGTATLDGADVSSRLSGEFYLVPGENVIGFESEDGNQTKSTLSWNNFLQ